jgi:hypothetical protein
MPAKDGRPYSTEDELAFIGDLGRGGVPGVSRIDLLKSYRAAASRRTRWGHVCRGTVLKAVDHALSVESSWSVSNRVKK